MSCHTETILTRTTRRRKTANEMKETIQPTMVEATRIRTTKHANRQQLPHLWWWLIVVIATNLFSRCSLTQAISSNGSSNYNITTMKPILNVAATSHNNATNIIITTNTATTTNTTAATFGATIPATNNITNVFVTETHFEVTRHVRKAGKVKEIENKPAAENENKKSTATTTTGNELSEIFISWSNTSNIEWFNLTDVVNSHNDYTRTKASPDQNGSESSFSTTLSLNHSDGNLFTFHEDCLANNNTLSHISTILLYSLVCVVGLFGNTLVIWVVLRFSKMQTVTNIYILNLAIADECFLIGIPFLLYTMRICSWKFGNYMCKAYMVSTSITQFTSSIFLLIMAADRYIAVCHPIESPKYRTLRIAKLVSILAWFTSAVLMLPVILFASTVRQEDGVNFSCNIDWPEVYKKHSGTTFILYTFLLGFATPLCFILVFYYLVIRKLHSVQLKHKSKEKKRSHRKVTRLVLTVITVYILCWLPHWISQVSLISAFLGQRELSRFEILLFLLFGCLPYSNSAMNPILYAFLSDNFRKSFSRAFTCMNRQEVEAQLINEHSVFTHKRKSSRNLTMPKTSTPIQNSNCKFLTPTTVHNSACGSSSGGTSTSTSTATTATDKSSNITKQMNERCTNGAVASLCTNTNEESVNMVVVRHDHHRSHGFKTAVCEVETQNQTNV